MEFSEILVYILSGYGLVSILALGKIFYTLSSLQMELKLSKYKCQQDVKRLEDKIYRYIEYDNQVMKKDIETLLSIKNDLVDVSSSIEIPSEKTLLKG